MPLKAFTDFVSKVKLRRRSSSLPVLYNETNLNALVQLKRRHSQVRISLIDSLPVFYRMAEADKGENTSPPIEVRRQLFVDSTGQDAKDYPAMLYSLDTTSEEGKLMLTDIGGTKLDLMRNISDIDDQTTQWAEFDSNKTGPVILWKVDHDEKVRYFASRDAFAALRNTYELIGPNRLQKSLEVSTERSEASNTFEDDQEKLQQEEDILHNGETAPLPQSNLDELNDSSESVEIDDNDLLREAEVRIEPIHFSLRGGKQVASNDITYREKALEVSQLNSRLKIKNSKLDATVRKQARDMVNLGGENKKLVLQVAELKRKLEINDEINGTIMQKQNQIDQKLANAEQQAQNSIESVRHLTYENNAAMDIIDELKTENREKDAEIEEYKKVIEQYKQCQLAQSEDHKAEIEENNMLKKAIQEKTEQLDTQTFSSQLLQKERVEKDKEIQKLKEENEELTQELEDEKVNHATAIKLNNELTEEVEKLEKDIEERENNITELQERNRQCEREIEIKEEFIEKQRIATQIVNEEKVRFIKRAEDLEQRLIVSERNLQRSNELMNIFQEQCVGLGANQIQQRQHERQQTGFQNVEDEEENYEVGGDQREAYQHNEGD